MTVPSRPGLPLVARISQSQSAFLNFLGDKPARSKNPTIMFPSNLCAIISWTYEVVDLSVDAVCVALQSWRSGNGWNNLIFLAKSPDACQGKSNETERVVALAKSLDFVPPLSAVSTFLRTRSYILYDAEQVDLPVRGEGLVADHNQTHQWEPQYLLRMSSHSFNPSDILHPVLSSLPQHNRAEHP